MLGRSHPVERLPLKNRPFSNRLHSRLSTTAPPSPPFPAQPRNHLQNVAIGRAAPARPRPRRRQVRPLSSRKIALSRYDLRLHDGAASTLSHKTRAPENATLRDPLQIVDLRQTPASPPSFPTRFRCEFPASLMPLSFDTARRTC